MTTGERIKELRLKNNMTMEELAEKLGLQKAAIYKYESGLVVNLKRSVIEKLSQIFNVSPSYIMCLEDTPAQSAQIPIAPNISPMPEMKQWKVLGGTACGEPIFKELEEESVWAPVSIDADFVFRCVGDSMINSRIFDGDIVFVKSCPVEDGQIGVVRIGDEYTLKRIYHGPDYLELRAENPMYKPIIIRGEQENAEIVGRAVQFLSRVI